MRLLTHCNPDVLSPTTSMIEMLTPVAHGLISLLVIILPNSIELGWDCILGRFRSFRASAMGMMSDKKRIIQNVVGPLCTRFVLEKRPGGMRYIRPVRLAQSSSQSTQLLGKPTLLYLLSELVPSFHPLISLVLPNQHGHHRFFQGEHYERRCTSSVISRSQ